MKNFKIPHVFIFLSAIILFSSMLTYIVPSGKFDRTTRVIDNVLMASLAIAGVPFDKWIRFIWPLFLILTLVAGLFIAAALYLNY